MNDRPMFPAEVVQRCTTGPAGRIHSVVDLRHPDGNECEWCLIPRSAEARPEYVRRRAQEANRSMWRAFRSEVES